MPAAFVFVLLLEFLSLENLSLILRCTNQEPTEEAQRSSQTLALGAVGPVKGRAEVKNAYMYFIVCFSLFLGLSDMYCLCFGVCVFVCFLLLNLWPPSLPSFLYSLAQEHSGLASHICSPQLERRLQPQ